MRSSRACIVLALGLAAFAAAAPAPAAMPGMNGKIAFQSERDGNVEVYAMNPDGSAQTNLTNSATSGDYTPAWSPDGRRIVIACSGASEICLRNADGSGSGSFFTGGMILHPSWSPHGTRLTFDQEIFFCDPPDDPNECELSHQIAAVDIDGTDFAWITENGLQPSYAPAWSPRGDRIVFVRTNLHTIRPDGTSETPLAVFGDDPNWSPDGTRIAYSKGFDTSLEIFVANADGTGETRLTTNTVADRHPAWSPDGTKIAFTGSEGGDDEIFVMNANGTGRQQLTDNAAADSEPDWQPLPYPGYARPKGATPFRVSLVPAAQACTAPNRTHGPPLAFGSCSPVQPESPNLTVSQGDARLRSVGFVRMDVIVGAPNPQGFDTDVQVRFSLTNVMNSSDFSDYTGTLTASTGVRLTDREGDQQWATSQDFDYSYAVPCTATADTFLGSTCAATTSFDALVPGSAADGERAIWALGQFRVLDGAGKPFAVQGVFVP